MERWWYVEISGLEIIGTIHNFVLRESCKNLLGEIKSHPFTL